MNKQTQRKYLSQANRKSHLGIHFQENLASLIKGKERTLRTKAAKKKYHLPVVEEKMMIVVVVEKTQSQESHGILNPAEKSSCLEVTACKSRPIIEKG